MHLPKYVHLHILFIMSVIIISINTFLCLPEIIKKLFCLPHWQIILLILSKKSLNFNLFFSENKTIIFTCLENPP